MISKDYNFFEGIEEEKQEKQEPKKQTKEKEKPKTDKTDKTFKIINIVYGRNGNGIDVLVKGEIEYQIHVHKSVNLSTKYVGKYVKLPHKLIDNTWIFEMIESDSDIEILG